LHKADLGVAVQHPEALMVSSTTGEGLDRLRQHLLEVAGLGGDASAGAFSARERHLRALDAVIQEMDKASGHLRESELDLLAECLRQAQQHLSEIIGEFSSDDLLGEIFGRFCIGK
jgi:tRNA modification GTPase